MEYILENVDEIEDWYLEMVEARKQQKPWVVYQDERYIVREISVEDLPQLYEMYAKSGVKEYVEPLYEYAEEKEFTESYIKNMYGFYGYGLWLIFDAKTGKLMGRAGFSHREIDGDNKVELGYIIDADYQSRGHGAAICELLLELGRDRWDFEDVFICCEQDNERSNKIALKLGFKFYGKNEKYVFYDKKL